MSKKPGKDKDNDLAKVVSETQGLLDQVCMPPCPSSHLQLILSSHFYNHFTLMSGEKIQHLTQK